MITLQEARTPQTAAEVQQGLLADLAAAGVDAAGFSPFSVTDALPGVVAKALAHQTSLRADIARLSFLELLINAPGADAWTDHIVYAWFGIRRIPATKAKWLFRVAAVPAVGTVTAPPRTLIAEAGVVLFENTTEITISGGQGFLKEFECRVAGTAGNILPHAVTGFKVGLAGLLTTNFAGGMLYAGRDQERNADYIARGRAKFAARARGGSRAAYLVWVHEAFDVGGLVSPITKIGVDDTNPNGPGSTDIYLANAAGPATPTEVGVVDEYLQAFRGLGTGPLRVLPAPAKTAAIAGVLYSTSATALAEAGAKWQALAADLPLGGGPKGVLYLDAIRGAVLGPDGVAGVYKFDVSSPAGDTRLSTFDVVTFSTGGVSQVVG